MRFNLLHLHCRQNLKAENLDTSFVSVSFTQKASAKSQMIEIQVRLALEVGFKGSDIFLNGCGKQAWELELAIDNGCFLNVDSRFDAENICRMADLKQKIVQVNISAPSDLPKSKCWLGMSEKLSEKLKPILSFLERCWCVSIRVCQSLFIPTLPLEQRRASLG